MYKSALRTIFLVTLLSCPLILSYAGQGMEKFQGWQQFRTKHFIFIYEEKDKQALNELLTFCEEAYDKVTRYFDSYPAPIPCLLRGRIDRANGFFSPMPFKIEIFLTSPTEPWAGARTENWLKYVFTHELTHYVHFVYQKGFWAGLSYLLGEEAKAIPLAFAPGWMIEGITTNTETMFTTGGRGRNPFFEVFYKAPAMENRLFSMQHAAYNSPFPPPGRQYVGGYILVHYLMQEFGEDVFARIHRRFLKFPFFGPWAAIKKVTGQSARTIYSNLRKELERRYHDDSLLPDGKRLTTTPNSEYSLPYITERGWYLYRSTLDRFPALVRFDPVTGQEEVLLECLLSDNSSFTAAPDGKKLYFTVITENPYRWGGPEEVSDLYSFEPATKKRRQLTDHAHLWHPALSPDKTRLVAVQRNGTYSRLVEVNQSTGAVELLFDPGEATIYNPTFSPDSRQLAFTMNIRGMQDIYLLTYPATAGGTLPAVAPAMTTDADGEYFPQFTDNGHLLFVSDKNKRLELWQYALANGELALLCQDPVGVLAGIVWQDRIVYQAYTATGYCLKQKPAAPLPAQPLAPAEPAPVPAPVPAPFTWPDPQNITGRPFYDPAWPQVWAPYPSLNNLNTSEVSLGIGLLLTGYTLTDDTTWLATLAFQPLERQPLVHFEWQRRFGPFAFTYQFDQTYTYALIGAAQADFFQQTSSQTARVRLPLVYTDFWPYRTTLHFNFGINHSFSGMDSAGFTFSEGFFSPSVEREQALTLLPGLAFQSVKVGGIRDLFAPWDLLSIINLSLPLPVFEESDPGLKVIALISLQFPSFIENQVFKLGIKAGYTTFLPSLRSATLLPRGETQTIRQTQEGCTLFALDYLFTIALLDLPLFHNLHCLGLSGGFHMETSFSWSLVQSTWQHDKYLYAGFEIAALMAYQTFKLPVGIGLSIRFTPFLNQLFNPEKDLLVYIFFSLDSFLTALK